MYLLSYNNRIKRINTAFRTTNFIMPLFLNSSNALKFQALLFFSLFLCQISFSQNVDYPLWNDRAYHIMDRLDLMTGGDNSLHTALKSISRYDCIRVVNRLDSLKNINLLPLDNSDLQYLRDDNPTILGNSEDVTTLTGDNENKKIPEQATSFWKKFYKRPADLWYIDTKYFDLSINPVINFQVAPDLKDDNRNIFTNTRGIILQGTIDDKLHFYSNIYETQSQLPSYGVDYVSKYALPGAGLVKDYSSSIFKVKNGYDYLLSDAYLSFNATKHINIKFGHGTNFIGDGEKSLILSDFAGNYLYLKLTTKVWKFQYQNIFAELTAGDPNVAASTSQLITKKYIALHDLDYKISNNFSLGIYESIIFARKDHFEFQYLNPVIFYRTVEGSLGSPDNVVIGTNFKWNLKKKYSIYGQLVLDEFVFKELFVENRNSWVNKYGFQIGAKSINTFGIDHLDFQIEANFVRPYTYTHFDSVSNYTHQNKPLADALGANFKEYLGIVRYQPSKNLFLKAIVMLADVGEDAPGLNYGNDILTDYTTRIMDYGNVIGQGVKANISLVSVDASWQFHHNMLFNLQMLARKKTSDDPSRNQSTLYFGGGVKINIDSKPLLF